MSRVSQGSVLTLDLMNVFVSELDRNTEGKPTKFLNDISIKRESGDRTTIFFNDFGMLQGTKLLTVSCNLIGVMLKPARQNQKQSIG